MTPRSRAARLAGALGIAAAAAAAAPFLGPAGEGGAAEKHGGNIVFPVLKPTREIREHVLFSHELHLAKGAVCKDCHNGTVFLEEKKMGVNQFTMKDVSRGKACGSCHDGVFRMKGTTVFAPTRNCARCHNLKWRKPPAG
jgi:c(7)-type cytochrome triheme protein